MHDALIIGGGPAGSLAAYLLATAGWDVALIEQHLFPRQKVCGECLSTLGIETLTRAGLTDQIAAAMPTRLTRAALYPARGGASFIDLRGEMWGVSRQVLDATLLEAARSAGAKLIQPARAEDLQPQEAIVRNLRTNERTRLKARHILLADGKGALLPRRPAATPDFGIKAHFTDVEAKQDTIGLFGFGHSYGGVAAIEGGRWNAAFSVNARNLHAAHGQLDNLFASIQRQNPTLSMQFRNARRVSEWCTSPLPRFGVADEWPAGVIPIGNAAAALEPIGGEGMGLALRSAELAIEALLRNPDKIDRPALRAEFRRLWTVRRFACRTAALALSSSLARPTAQILARSDTIAALALRLMGKGVTRASSLC
jgi:flavin-dependent dehydrogenase